MKNAKQTFLNSEGDEWFHRNMKTLEAIDFSNDWVGKTLCTLQLPAGTRLLEIGSGGGGRLSWLQKNLKWECQGIEPSAKAVSYAQSKGLKCFQGTADNLPFEVSSFDIVVFGFCLYLCDRNDLFKIAFEADRVLKSPGWLLILDFYSETPIIRPYHHYDGLFSHKMDYRKLFSWHPAYTCYSHEIRSHGKSVFTDDCNEWVSLSIMRKVSPNQA